jgi:hypothetical protein
MASSGDGEDVYPECPVQFEGTGAFIQGGASGHDIVQEQDALTGKVNRAMKGAADVGMAFRKRQLCLGPGCQLAPTNLRHDWQIQPRSQVPGDFPALIEATLCQPLRVERQGHEAIPIGAVGKQHGSQPVPKQGRQSQFVSVFQGMEQGIQWMLVTPQGPGPVEMGRVAQTVATPLAAAVRLGTTGAGSRTQMGEVGLAGLADQGAVVMFAAEQTGAGQQAVEHGAGSLAEEATALGYN